jgi:hypothetical protein
MGAERETLTVDQNLLLAFCAVAVLIAAFHFIRLRQDAYFHKTLQEAIRANSPIVPELLAQMQDRPRRRTQTTGFVLLAIAAAMCVAGFIQGEPKSAAAAALFPALIGVVIVWRATLKRRGG